MMRPKGTRDLFGEELSALRQVEGTVRDLFRKYSYEEVETPMFENFELFEKKSGSTVIEQLYAFKDKSGRMLALRPELTAPAIRFYIVNLKSAPQPVKLCYFGSCFRYEEPQSQRWRQFTQAGVEIIGSDRPEADVEVMALVADTMQRLGLRDFDLRVGHVGVLRKLLEHAGVRGDSQDPILRAIDRRDEERIESEIERAGLNVTDKKILIELVNSKGESSTLENVREITKGVAGVEKNLENLSAISMGLPTMGAKFSFDFGIARGLEYYTGAVFEVYVDKVQVAGGGRYDDLVELLGGKPCPAVGVGFGVDRLAKILVSRGKVDYPGGPDFMVLPVAPEVVDECLKIVKELRDAGVRADVELMGRKLTKALASADSRNVGKVIVVGPKDLEQGEVTIRDMGTGEQTKLPRKDLAKKISGTA